ncbi:MAG: hypothetical protein ABS81_10895 [Pseudonocardia sp. SCN 72-86]|mgnify:CR=1 FL=1|nr:MAG: hypothetical protein ABS81_10895 [Pseudonocardia sp. SCN 72-86]
MKAVSEESFDREVLSAVQPVLVDFWAPWCASCKAMTPVLERIAAARPDWGIVAVDLAESAGVAARFSVLTLPTLLVFRDGAVTERLTGLRTEQDVLALMGNPTT